MRSYLAAAAAVLTVSAAASYSVAANAEPQAGLTAAKHRPAEKRVLRKKHLAQRPAPTALASAPAPAPAYEIDPTLAPPLVPLARYFSQIPLPASDGSLTYHGITIYGGVDMGIGYQTHGTPLSPTYGAGRQYFLANNNYHTQIGLMPNALSYSNIGVKGVEEFYPGWSAVFNLDTTFNPSSGQLSNAKNSIVQNNLVPINQRLSQSDSSLNGQAFNGFVYGGLSNKTFGTLTYGRQTSLTADGVTAYDPMSGSSAFSVIGYQGATAGAGDTEDRRLDNSLKYRVNAGPLRFAAQYQIQEYGNYNRNGYQFQAGGEYNGFAFDAIYSMKHDAIASSNLTTLAQVRAAPDSLVGTVSDNEAVMLLAKYTWNKFKFYAGYENIRYMNPENPLAPGSEDQGVITNPLPGGTVNTAYGATAANPRLHNKIFQQFWGGVKYSATEKLDLVGAYYHQQQNNFGGNANCSTAATFSGFAGTCSGTLDAGSMLVDYRFNKHLDVYFGAMYILAHKGLVAGYETNNTIDPTAGLRFQF